MRRHDARWARYRAAVPLPGDALVVDRPGAARLTLAELLGPASPGAAAG
jgi:hypothetical protein